MGEPTGGEDVSTAQPDVDDASSGGPGGGRGRLVRLVAVLVLAGLAVQLYVATTGGRSRSADAVVLPTNDWAGGGGRTALLRGRVGGSATVDGGCVWIESDFGGRAPVIWPRGFSASFDPVRIYDGAGRVVAGEGDMIEVGGGSSPGPGPRCMFGQPSAFSVESAVDVVEG